MRVGDAAEGLRALRKGGDGGARFEMLIEPWRVGGTQ